MPVQYVNDGNFTVPQQNGATEFKFPFYDKGDETSFEATITMRVAAVNYQRTPSMSTKSFKVNGVTTLAYLVEETPAQSVGQGLLESKLTYASIPIPRDEYSATVYGYQILRSQTDQDTASVSEFQLTLATRIHYQYSLTLPSVLQNPNVQVINTDGENPTIIYYFGGWGAPGQGAEVLSKGQERAIYKCKIYVLISTYVTIPTWTN